MKNSWLVWMTKQETLTLTKPKERELYTTYRKCFLQFKLELKNLERLYKKM